MKKILVLVLIFTASTAFTPVGNGAAFDFVGKWIGKDITGAKGGFIFDKQGYASIVKGDQIMGGKAFNLKGKIVSMKYTMDQSGTPIKFDLILEDVSAGRIKKRLFIVKVINHDKIIMAQGDKGKRPTAFTEGNSITLTRQK